ncbi:MAG: hypothetical protein JNK93_07555 [Planctomycetia bacterium]|nr:hypothetical protein [Planctomycetia bacterium]
MDRLREKLRHTLDNNGEPAAVILPSGHRAKIEFIDPAMKKDFHDTVEKISEQIAHLAKVASLTSDGDEELAKCFMRAGFSFAVQDAKTLAVEDDEVAIGSAYAGIGNAPSGSLSDLNRRVLEGLEEPAEPVLAWSR